MAKASTKCVISATASLDQPPPPGDQERTFGCLEQALQFLEGLCARRGGGAAIVRRHECCGEILLHILGKRDHHRTGAAVDGDMEGAAQ